MLSEISFDLPWLKSSTYLVNRVRISATLASGVQALYLRSRSLEVGLLKAGRRRRQRPLGCIWYPLVTCGWDRCFGQGGRSFCVSRRSAPYTIMSEFGDDSGRLALKRR